MTGHPVRWTAYAAIMLTLAWTGAAAAATFDFEEWPGGTILSTGPRLDTIGIRAQIPLEVIDCASDPNCGHMTGSKVAAGVFRGEFARERVEIDFLAPQRQVQLSVRSEADRTPPSPLVVSMTASDAAGNPAGSTSVLLPTDRSWRRLSIGSEFLSPRISKIIVAAGEAYGGGEFHNLIAIDDLTFEPGVSGRPVARDTTLPTIRILRPPANSAVMASPVNVRIEANDDTALDSVRADLQLDATGVRLGSLDFCGTSFALDRACPATGGTSYLREGRMELPGLLTIGALSAAPGTLIATVCDTAGQCAADTMPLQITFGGPEPEPARIVPLAAEVNQAVQPTLFALPAPGHFATGHSPVPLLSGKHMVVRFYLASEARRDFSGRLRFHLWRGDGSEETLILRPNIGNPPATDVALAPHGLIDGTPRQPSLNRALSAMRVMPQMTVNFVVPWQRFQHAERIEIQLQEAAPPNRAVTGRLQFLLNDPVRLGLYFTALQFMTGIDGDVAQINGYLRNALPVSEVRDLGRLPGFAALFGASWMSDRQFACRVKDALYGFYGGGDAPPPIATTDPRWTAVIGVGPFAGGCAKRARDPDDDDDRDGLVATTAPVGSIAAHEVGHILSLVHAGSQHGECAGGACERGWPNPHGLLTSNGVTGDFGVAIAPAPPPYPAGTFFGLWNVFLVDPCAGAGTLDRRAPCSLAARDFTDPSVDLTHDIMSYGGRATPAAFPLSAASNVWVSSITYNRIYAAIRHRQLPDFRDLEDSSGLFSAASPQNVAGRAAGRALDEGVAGPREGMSESHESAERIPALVLIGTIDQSGRVGLLPIFPKDVVPSAIVGQKQVESAYRVQLLDAHDSILFEAPLPVQRLEDDEPGILSIVGYVPRFDDLGSLMILRGDQPIFERKASETAPELRIRPFEQDRCRSEKKLRFEWEAADPVGEPLAVLIEVSAGLDMPWRPVAMLDAGTEEAERGELEIEKDFLGNDPQQVRITVSNGIRFEAGKIPIGFCFYNKQGH